MTNNSSKIALVTGSSRGLGKSTALNLAKKGVDSLAKPQLC
jgi:NAD(P)-dependent dehydrogenase (short-subunit alcohol dehydrogenase family)